MKITTKFDLHQKVLIKDIDTVGKIRQIRLNGLEDIIKYDIDYWFNGEIRGVSVLEEEIQAV